jgi:DNA-binding response OmpR family regulator
MASGARAVQRLLAGPRAVRVAKAPPPPQPIRVLVDDGIVEMPCGSRWRLQRRIVNVLAALARMPRRVVSQARILAAMYGGPDYEPEWSESSMKNAISHLRRAGLPIVTRYGQGYVLEADAVVIESKDTAA